jgi:hypothetical protein
VPNGNAQAEGWWSVLVPLIACAFCPACLAVWAPFLATLGIGIVLSEAQHGILLFLAVTVSIGLAALRARRTAAWVPFALTVAGGSILLSSHWLGENVWLSLLGIAGLLSGTIFARPRPQRVAVSERL